MSDQSRLGRNKQRTTLLLCKLRGRRFHHFDLSGVITNFCLRCRQSDCLSCPSASARIVSSLICSSVLSLHSSVYQPPLSYSLPSLGTSIPATILFPNALCPFLSFCLLLRFPLCTRLSLSPSQSVSILYKYTKNDVVSKQLH